MFGAFITGGYLPTVSAHRLIVDFNGGKVGDCIQVEALNDCITQFVSFADKLDCFSGDVSCVDEPKDNPFVKDFLNEIKQQEEYANVGIGVEVSEMKSRHVVILKNGDIPTKQSERLLEGVQCGKFSQKPKFEIVFDSVTCELDRLNKDFLTSVTSIGFTNSTKISLTGDAPNLLSKFGIPVEFVGLGCAQQRKNVEENTENKNIFKDQDADNASSLAEKERSNDLIFAKQLQAKSNAENSENGLPAQENSGKFNPKKALKTAVKNGLEEQKGKIENYLNKNGVMGTVLKLGQDIQDIQHGGSIGKILKIKEFKNQAPKTAVENELKKQKGKIENYIDKNGVMGAVLNFGQDIQDIQHGGSVGEILKIKEIEKIKKIKEKVCKNQ